MDNPEEVRYECLEEQYLSENAKFKVGNIVYFEHTVEDKHKMCIGVITKCGIKQYNRYASNGTYKFTGIVYDIVTPVELCEGVSECKLTSASEFIYREYIYNTAK